jgi:hypothetical protein
MEAAKKATKSTDTEYGQKKESSDGCQRDREDVVEEALF